MFPFLFVILEEREHSIRYDRVTEGATKMLFSGNNKRGLQEKFFDIIEDTDFLVFATKYSDLMGRSIERLIEEQQKVMFVLDRFGNPVYYTKLLTGIISKTPILNLLPPAVVQTSFMGGVVAIILTPSGDGKQCRLFQFNMPVIMHSLMHDPVQEVRSTGSDAFEVVIGNRNYTATLLTHDKVLRDYMEATEKEMKESTEDEKFPHLAVIDSGSDTFKKVRRELSYNNGLEKFFSESFSEETGYFEKMLTFAFKEKADRDMLVAVLNGFDPEDVPPPISVH